MAESDNLPTKAAGSLCLVSDNHTYDMQVDNEIFGYSGIWVVTSKCGWVEY